MKYQIVYSYNTGNSFGKKTCDDQKLEYTWTNLEKAIESLNRIHAHYEAYKKYNHRLASREEREALIEKISKEPWFDHSKKYGSNFWEMTVILVGDNGEPYQVWTQWTGHFESLNYAKISAELPRFDYS